MARTPSDRLLPLSAMRLSHSCCRMNQSPLIVLPHGVPHVDLPRWGFPPSCSWTFVLSQFLGIPHAAATDTAVPVFVGMHTCGNGMAGSPPAEAAAKLLPKCAPLYVPTHSVSSHFSVSLPTPGVPWLLHCQHLTRCVVISLCGFHLHFLDDE